MNEGGLEVIDCNNHVKSATKYFGPSCAVNALTDTYNPVGECKVFLNEYFLFVNVLIVFEN